MIQNLITVFKQGLFCTLVVCLLAACEKPKPEAPSKPPAPVKTYSAQEYVSSLATLHLFDGQEQAKHVEAVNGYIAQQTKIPQPQEIVVLDYGKKEQEERLQLAVPVSFNAVKPSFPELQHALQQLAERDYVLHNISVKTAQIMPFGNEALPSAKDDVFAEAVSMHERRLLENTASLSTREDIEAQLQLIHFFIQHRFRDAAYIAVDNTKKQLALLARDKPEDIQTLKRLSQRLETLESRMRKVMPFTL